MDSKSFNDAFRRALARSEPETEAEPVDQQADPPPRRHVPDVDAGAGTGGQTREVPPSVNDAIRKAMRGF